MEIRAQGYRLVLDIVFLLEPFDPPCGIDEFLFSCVEGMAVRTDLYRDILSCRACFNHAATNAGNRRFFISRMYVFLHNLTPS